MSSPFCVLSKNENLSVSFCGSGFLATYQLGAAQSLLDNAAWILQGAPRVYGASAGSLVAAAVACGSNLGNLRSFYSYSPSFIDYGTSVVLIKVVGSNSIQKKTRLVQGLVCCKSLQDLKNCSNESVVIKSTFPQDVCETSSWNLRDLPNNSRSVFSVPRWIFSGGWRSHCSAVCLIMPTLWPLDGCIFP